MTLLWQLSNGSWEKQDMTGVQAPHKPFCDGDTLCCSPNASSSLSLARPMMNWREQSRTLLLGGVQAALDQTQYGRVPPLCDPLGLNICVRYGRGDKAPLNSLWGLRTEFLFERSGKHFLCRILTVHKSKQLWRVPACFRTLVFGQFIIIFLKPKCQTTLPVVLMFSFVWLTFVILPGTSFCTLELLTLQYCCCSLGWTCRHFSV